MTAVVEAVELSDLLTWPTDHLTQAADHWEALGERSFGVAHGVWSDALTVDWRGEAAEALRADTHADMQTTSAVVDQLQAAAGIARRGASDLDAARSEIRYAVEDARSAGFVVDEDLSIIDRFAGGSASEQVARQAAAEAFAEDIGGRAAQLVDLDAQVAGKITAAMAGVGNAFPPVSGRQAHAAKGSTAPQRRAAVNPVNWTTDKPPAPPDPPKVPSADDMRKVFLQLPRGKRDIYREVKSPEDLERLKQWMTEHGVDMQSHYPIPEDGRWKRLPDGSEVGERNKADSTGQKALDIDLKRPDGTTEHWKIHINPGKGGIPEIPTELPAPAKPAPAESAPSRAAPAEPELIPEGMMGGSPGMTSTPSFIPEPGSKHHLAPIVGVDEPGEDERDFSH